MAYPKGVMDLPVSRALGTIDSAWSTPQLLAALSSAINGQGCALATRNLSITQVKAEVALVVATSGSTGAAKDVLLSSQALLASARATNDFIGAESGAVWSLLLPTSHIAGINVLVRSLELQTIPVGINDGADFSAIVPTQLFRAVSGDTALLRHLQNCRAVLVGGGPLDRELRSRAEDIGIKIITTYGMTESCGGVVYNGSPLPGVELCIINERVGIKAAQLALGYLQGDLPMSDGFFLTSDFGLIEDAKLVVTGRSDDQIISGGEKLSLGTIETFLQRTFDHLGIVAFARADEQWGQRLCIATTLRVSAEDISISLKNEFGRTASPKEVIFLDEIPYLSIGKPDRKKLADDDK